MKKSWLNVLSIAALAGVMTLASCGVTPSSSSSNSEAPQSSKASEASTSSAQEEVTLSKIEVTKLPTKVEYEEGEFLDLTGMEVTATFSDASTKVVTSECTTNKDGVALTAADKNFYVKYTYGGKTKSAAVSITVKAEEIPVAQNVSYDHLTEDPWAHFTRPYDIVKSSKADMLFYTFYDSTTMQMDGAMELNYKEGSLIEGTFKYTEFNAIDPAVGIKIAAVSGTWSIKESTMTFLTTLIEHMDGTAKLDAAGKETCEIAKEGDVIKGLYFGSMLNSVDTFFGWGKTKESAFVESLATQYEHPASTVYMQRIENNVFAANLKTYYGSAEKIVAKIEAETPPNRLSYYEGENFSDEGLSLRVTYEDTTDAVVTEGWSIDKEGALALTDTKIVVTYGGKTLEIAITVEKAPVVAVLSGIRLENAPTKLAFRAGQTKNFSDLVDLSSVKVIGTYSDGSEKELSGATVVDAEAPLSMTKYTGNDPVSYTVKYVDGENEFTAAVNEVSLSYLAPIDVFKTSDATYSLFTYWTKGSGNKVNATLELNGDLTKGTYSYYALASDSKGKLIEGEYSVADGVITFAQGEQAGLADFGGLASAGAISSPDTVGTLVMDGERLAGIQFAQMNTKIDSSSKGFFGYTATKDFSASIAQVYTNDANAVSLGYAVTTSHFNEANETILANIYYPSVL